MKKRQRKKNEKKIALLTTERLTGKKEKKTSKT